MKRQNDAKRSHGINFNGNYTMCATLGPRWGNDEKEGAIGTPGWGDRHAVKVSLHPDTANC